MSDAPPPESSSPRSSQQPPAVRPAWGRIAGGVGCLVFVLLAIVALLLPAVPSVRTAAKRSVCKTNLKQLGLALWQYHELYGCFPPAYIADENGRPMHSWRVLILPQLDDQPLFDKYRFDEPWDGPNNRLLADSIPAIYRCPADDPTNTSTNYVAVVGSEAAWSGERPLSIADFSDGPSGVIQLVEVASSGIHWMEPRDLHVIQMAPTVNAKAGQGISSKHIGGAHALFGDGGVRFLDEKTAAKMVRGSLTRNGRDEALQF